MKVKMNKGFLIGTVFFMMFGMANAQENVGFAVSQDADGYTNIRRQPGLKAPVKIQLPSGTLIFTYGLEPDTDWLGIIYLSEFGNTTDEATVFIHQSRIKMLEQFPALKKKIRDADTVQLVGHHHIVTVKAKKFNPKQHRLTVKKTEGGFLEYPLIDGKDYMGSDHMLPDTEYALISVNRDGKETALPKAAYADLFNPNRIEAYEDAAHKRLFIVAYNGSGAGAYAVCWEIVNGVYTKRLVVSRGY